MRTIELSAAAWETQDDFFHALKVAIGAPDWHGSNCIAFSDSMIGGGINALVPPYIIKVVNAESLPLEVIDLISILSTELDRSRAQKRFRTGEDVSVTLEFDRVTALGAPTVMNEARLVVEKWKQVHHLDSLAPRLVDDLAERVERAIRTRGGISEIAVEAGARALFRAGTHHNWWKPYNKTYDEMAATDPIAKSEFDGIVEQILMAAHAALPTKQ